MHRPASYARTRSIPGRRFPSRSRSLIPKPVGVPSYTLIKVGHCGMPLVQVIMISSARPRCLDRTASSSRRLLPYHVRHRRSHYSPSPCLPSFGIRLNYRPMFGVALPATSHPARRKYLDILRHVYRVSKNISRDRLSHLETESFRAGASISSRSLAIKEFWRCQTVSDAARSAYVSVTKPANVTAVSTASRA